ncbi:MAG: helix-turn-helix transcriptional regulator [Patescibacteria group bacterium]
MNTQKDEQLGKHIKKARKSKNITQEQLSEMVRVTPKYIQYIEAGKRSPSLKSLYKIAKALGVKVKDLMPF